MGLQIQQKLSSLVMDLAPAVVTRAVSDLEDHLGARLLNRTTRKLALTEVGQDYLDRAKRVLAELDDADALAGAVNKAPSGTLRILCPPAFATHQLVRHLPIFRQRFPGIHHNGVMCPQLTNSPASNPLRVAASSNF